MLKPITRACAMKPLDSLQGHVRGFATTTEARSAILEYGLPERHVFTRCVGAEDLEPCLATYRGRPGWLVLAQDARVFGTTKRQVAERLDFLEKAKIQVLDIIRPEHASYSAHLQCAQMAISGARFTDRRRARSQGRSGGLAKGRRAREWRNALAPEWLIDRIVDEDRVSWEAKASLLHPHFSESTLRRWYGAKNAARRR